MATSELGSLMFTASFMVLSMILYYMCLVKKKPTMKPSLPLPPGPRGLPIVGSLPFIESELHAYFDKLAKTYGPVIKLKLGSKLVVSIGSSSAAKEILRDYDTIFANRDPTRATVAVSNGLGFVWTPYGFHWRTRRMICVSEALTKANINLLYSLRKKELHQTIKQLYNKRDTPVDLGHHIFVFSLNTMTTMLWGGAYNDDETSTPKEFHEKSLESVGLLVKNNLSDCFPSLGRFDIQGIERGLRRIHSWFNDWYDSIITERIKLNQVEATTENRDFLDILLKLMFQGGSKIPITRNEIKALFMDMLAAGTDTTGTVLTWAMMEILDHPEIMRRIQEELRKVVGDNNMVEESHIPDLIYLDAVIRETYRLHPPVPLIPRLSSKSSVVGGYTIPQNTTIWMNVWALQRDPEVWENPLEFQPDRFLKDIGRGDYTGNNFNYLPFGSGRRVCVGISLAERTVPHALASLLHSFQWRLPEGDDLDRSGELKLLLRKKTPLIAIPTARLSNQELYLNLDAKTIST